VATTLRSLRRLRQITAVVARHGLDHYQERRRRARSDARQPPDLTAAEPESIPKIALRFRAILEDLGPTFVKFGQILSTRADLLPAGFAGALAGLQDDVAPMGSADAERSVELGLGRPLSELFAEFDEKPVASASIAQVHRAVTHDGQEVAVKVQRLGIRERIVEDLDLLRYLAQILESIVEESGLVTAAAIVDEFESAFLGELDFAREARMLQRFRAFADAKEESWYVVPAVFDDLSSATILTMEFLRGDRLGQLPPERDKKAIARNIVRGAFEQVFVDGLFHADPHPGNAFVLEDDRLALLDFGSVGEISYAMRETLMVLAIAIGQRDAETVTRVLYRVGIPGERVSLHRLRDACASLFGQYLHDQTTLANVEAAQLLRDLFEVAARFKVRIPSEYALIARASVVLEGVIRDLDPNLEVLEAAGPYLTRLVEEQFAVPELRDHALKGLLRARGFLQELPLTAAQILMDLETGKLQVQVENPKIDTIARNIDALGVTVFMSMVACGLITGSFFLLADYRVELWGIPVIPAIGLYLASVLFGGAFGRYLLLPRMRKLSLGRWLRRRRRT
jgi:ubiquinone biosynthesis protein